MARRFAEGTTVSPEASRAEIERLIIGYGCQDFGFRIRPEAAVINFAGKVKKDEKPRHVRFTLPLPPTEKGFKSRRAWEQEIRRLWRALVLSIKARLEIVQSGIEEFESAFLAQIVDPSTGQTMAETARPYLKARYAGLPAPDFAKLPAPEEPRP
jgi:hypothetical protein